jgi:hypothetical protein
MAVSHNSPPHMQRQVKSRRYLKSVIDIELFSKVSALQFGEFENILVIELGAQVGLFDEKIRV